MDSSIYQSPESTLDNSTAEVEDGFYLVSKSKLLILYLCTFGFYQTYWFYRHWKMQKLKYNDDSWPIMRAIFTIFFVHSLFENINIAYFQLSKKRIWSPSVWATIYVLLIIFETITDRLPQEGVMPIIAGVITLIRLPASAYILMKAQAVANLTMGDPLGESNTKLTLANYVWLAMGALVWLVIIIGIAAIFTDPAG